VKKPSAEILSQIAKGLRISAETLYVQAGILDERDSSDVVAAVLADPTIGERHKRVLLDVYESFRAEHAADVKPPVKKPAAKKSTAKKATAKKRTATTTTTTKTAKKRSTT
jgi:hypothetical protein